MHGNYFYDDLDDILENVNTSEVTSIFFPYLRKSIIIDLRSNSETYLKWISFEFKAGDNLSLHVPSGCANSWLTLEDSTTILYYMSEFYSPGSYTGFRYNDPLFSVKWPAKPAVISEKDEGFDNFDPKSI